MACNACPSLLYLWDKRTLYIGPFFETLDLSQGAATLIVALDKPLSFKMQGMLEAVECWSLLLPAGMSVCVNTNDSIIANCNLDPLGVDFAALHRLMKIHENGIAYELLYEDTFIACFMQIYQFQLESNIAYEQLDQLLSTDSQPHIDKHVIDQRIVEVIKLIKQTIDNNLSVDDLAAQVNLSVPRLVQLFKQQTGIPIRRYRLWHRLYVTAIRVGKGENFTDAALAAGFTDSSHYCHTFRSMFGMKPSFLVEQPNKIRIIVPDKAA